MPSHTVPGRRLELKMSEIRRQADSVLQHLLEERVACEQRMSELQREDPIRAVTGRSALDDAIRSTRDMISEIDQVLVSPLDARPRVADTNGHSKQSRVIQSHP